MTTTPKPELQDPVVIDGIKYRIKAFDTGEQTGWIRMARLKARFGGHEATAIADALRWDAIAGVWRTVE
jgi:hypothetical protein